MNCPDNARTVRALLRAAACAALLLLLFLGSARADDRHTFLLPCGGGGFVGVRQGEKAEQALVPAQTVRASDGRVWTLAELKALPGFTLQGAALRWNVEAVQGVKLEYSLVCGGNRSVPQRVLPGWNLWDVTASVEAWLEDPEQGLLLTPVYQRNTRGIRFREGSAVLQVTFSAGGGAPSFPQDRVQDDLLYEAGLSLLEAGSPFIARYDETADSLLRASLELGVPYYYGGRNEEKFLRRFFPLQTTKYYRADRQYLCGLDCVGLTQLVMEKRGLPEHPSIQNLIYRAMGTAALSAREPEEWPMFLLPGDLIVVNHGVYHILMYLGTMRKFGWTEADAGEAAPVLDAPLVIHCGDNPFYYDRYEAYIREQNYPNTWPPDGGVTVSVILRTAADAPHRTETAWGKEFSWYLADGSPLLVFSLENCTELAWYGPEP